MGMCAQGGACYAYKPGQEKQAIISCQCGEVQVTFREAGPRYKMACACIDCCKRGDFTRANGLVVQGETQRETRVIEAMMGNCIVDFKNWEICKLWQLHDKGMQFVICTKCFTEVFETPPPLSPEIVNVTSNGAKWLQVDTPVTMESTRASTYNCDLKKEYDPIRTNNQLPHRGQGPTMDTVEKTILVGLVRSTKMAGLPKYQKGDNSAQYWMAKILAHQGGKPCIANGGKGYGPKEHPSKPEPSVQMEPAIQTDGPGQMVPSQEVSVEQAAPAKAE